MAEHPVAWRLPSPLVCHGCQAVIAHVLTTATGQEAVCPFCGAALAHFRQPPGPSQREEPTDD